MKIMKIVSLFNSLISVVETWWVTVPMRLRDEKVTPICK